MLMDRSPRPVGPVPMRVHRWMAPTSMGAVSASITLMVAVGIQGPSVAEARFPPAPPWPPWFFSEHSSPLMVSIELWLALLLGGAGLAVGLAAVRRGWRPDPRRLIAGSVLAVVALLLIPPVGSADMLLYAVYGRIVAKGTALTRLRQPSAQLKASGDPVGVVAVNAHPNDPTRYGPVASAIEGLTSELTGTAVARDIFWLKVWNGLAYLGVVLALDRLADSGTARRVRVHLLWSLNPLMLWAAMANGHNDVLAACAGIAALLVMRRSSFRQAMLSGVLLGIAADIKAPYALFGAGLAWVAHRSPRALAALPLGAGAVLIPGYLLTGHAAITAVLSMGSTGPDGVWFDANRVLGWQHDAGATDDLRPIACSMLAVILLWRLPSGPPDHRRCGWHWGWRWLS